MIRLVEIDRGNWLKLGRLKIKDSQAGFVASNFASMAEAHYEEGMFPLGIYEDDVPVGFCMYGSLGEGSETWIIRLMIDAGQQSKGYGRKAMMLLLGLIRSRYGQVPVFLSFEPENLVARELYESLGFVADGRVIDGEIVYRLAP